MPSAKKNTSNGNQAEAGKATKPKPAGRRKQAPELTEDLRKLTLRAFRKTYEAHHGKSS